MSMYRLLPLVLLAATACAPRGPDAGTAPPPESRVVTPPPPAGARTADQFDTTSAAERQAAAAKPAAQTETRLGKVVVSLGDPASPGFWMETPLVSAVTKGRVVLPTTGASAQVELRPAGAGGNRLSLAAMRLLGADLTGLPEVEVFSGG